MLLVAPAVGVCVVVTPEVVLFCAPGVLLVTLKITVQLEPAGIVMPLKLSAVAPAVKVDGVVPAQVPVTFPPAAIIFTSVSVNAPPVSADALPFDKVRVTVELPPDEIVVGLNAFEIVGAPTTVRVALAELAVGPLVEVGVTVLFSAPADVPMTFTVTWHEPPGARLTPLRVTVPLAPAVPPQLLVKLLGDAIAMPAGRVSVNPTPVSVKLAFVLLSASVIVLVPLVCWMVVGLNDLLSVGGLITVSVADDALLAFPAAVESIVALTV